jgi:predicted porin
MKKSLFALAAVGAFAGAAQAQSSVTVYGIVDAGYAGGTQRGSTTTTSKATYNMFQMSGGESSNRLGFRGTEDLGGGLAANFVLETNLQANTDAWNPTWRQAWAGLSKKGLGAARIGTQNTLIWQLAAPMTVGQLNNFAGSVINGTNFAGNSNIVGTDSAANNGNIAFTNRTQRTLQVETERMSGFQAKAMYVLNEANNNRSNNATAGTGYTGGTNNFNGWGVSLDYTIAKFRVAGAYQALNAENPFTATAAASTSAAATTGYTAGAPAICPGNAQVNFNSFTGATTQCTNIKDNQTYVAATYDFGILTAYANYINRKATSQLNSSVYAKRSAQEIGVRGYVTKTIEGWASVGNGRYTAFGVNNPTANITGYQVGSNYWMSKRTNLYAIYGQTGTSATSAGSANINNYGVGVRHTF